MNPLGGTEVGKIYYTLDLNDKQFRSGLAQSETATNNFGTTLSKIGKLIGTAFIAKSVIDFGASTVKAFMDSQNQIAQTNAVLKSTHQIAGVTADQVTNLANSWQKMSVYSDESVRNVENVLLTFTNINKDIFPQTVEATLNIASALHEDLQSAAIQVGKALQDPILGITALRRVGVNFNDAQKEVIQNLVNTGKAAEAQQLILKELNTEFGGSAKAAGETYAGTIAKLKHQFDELKESIGGGLLNVIGTLAQAFIPSLRNAELYSFVTGSVTTVIGAQTAALQAQKAATDAVSTAEQNRTTAMNNLIPLQQAVQVAQSNLNNAIQTYGANSTQAQAASESLRSKQSDLFIQEGISKDATDKLSGAKSNLALANQDLTEKTKLLKQAQHDFGDEVTKKGGVLDIVDSFGKHLLAQINPIEVYIGELQNAINKGGLVLNQGSLIGAQEGLQFGGAKKRQGGGYVEANAPYVVGESGKELFIPKTSGQIIPNHRLGSNETTSINIVMHLEGVMARSRSELRDTMIDALKAVDERLTAMGKPKLIGNIT